MKQLCKVTLSFLVATTAPIHALGGGSESSIDGGKTGIVLSGTLETYKGHIYHVQEITFNKVTRKIALYEVPSAQSNIITDQKSEVEQKERPGDIVQLKDNPTQSNTEFFIDLESVAQITVPNPWQRWVFKKNHREIEFVEIIVTTKEKNTSDHYLVEKGKKIYAQEDGATIEVPLINVKKLTIEKVELRNFEKTKKINTTKPTENEPVKKIGIETAHMHPKKGRLARLAKNKALTA